MIYVHDIIAISGLAVRASIAYKDAPDGYRHISEEVAALKLLIDKVAPHFQSSTISQEDYHYGEKVLRDCQGVLQDLNRLFEKHRRLASINKRIDLNSVKLGKEDATTLHVQLISNTVLLSGFIRRCVVVFFINLIDINISIYVVVNMLRSKHDWLLFLVFTPRTQEFQLHRLLPLQPTLTRQPTCNSVNTCIELGSQKIRYDRIKTRSWKYLDLKAWLPPFRLMTVMLETKTGYWRQSTTSIVRTCIELGSRKT